MGCLSANRRNLFIKEPVKENAKRYVWKLNDEANNEIEKGNLKRKKLNNEDSNNDDYSNNEEKKNNKYEHEKIEEKQTSSNIKILKDEQLIKKQKTFIENLQKPFGNIFLVNKYITKKRKNRRT